ncbi:hypothetical protein [Falsarthrobacter nasiphocae]|uniref:putative acetyltransferase n=1 Tax=Falsarthrobacter nasiphocae TaxID=189863 RepID=UPI00337073E7
MHSGPALPPGASSRPPHPLASARTGTRWVVRYRLEDDDGSRPGLTDALGELIETNSTSVVIRLRSGEAVRIPKTRIAAAKEVPPAPPRRRGSPAGRVPTD